MRKECEAASWWVSQQLMTSFPPLSHQQIAIFQKILFQEMMQKFKGHWYEDEMDRGSAFRSILKEGRIIDTLLVRAGQQAGISNLEQRFRDDFVLWVDPSKVSVQFTKLFKRIDIYSSKDEASAPAGTSKPLLKNVTPTILVNKIRSEN